MNPLEAKVSEADTATAPHGSSTPPHPSQASLPLLNQEGRKRESDADSEQRLLSPRTSGW